MDVVLDYLYEEAVGVLETSLGNAREKLVSPPFLPPFLPPSLPPS